MRTDLYGTISLRLLFDLRTEISMIVECAE